MKLGLILLLLLASCGTSACGNVRDPIQLPVNEHWTPPTTQKLEA